MTAGGSVTANALVFLPLMTIMVLVLLLTQVWPVPGMRLLLTPNAESSRSYLLHQVRQIRLVGEDPPRHRHPPPLTISTISEEALMMTMAGVKSGARSSAHRKVLATEAQLEAAGVSSSSRSIRHHHHHPSAPRPHDSGGRPNLQEHAFKKLDPGGGKAASADNCRCATPRPATANVDHCSPSPEGEIDPRYGVEKRLVPTGPNPLHN